MSARVRKTRPGDYAMIAKWWKAHDFPTIPEAWLPETGLVAEIDGAPTAAVWLYLTDSAVAWVEWAVANPEAPERDAALAALAVEVERVAAEKGRRVVFACVGVDKVRGRLAGAGYRIGGRGLTSMFKEVG